MANDSIVFQPLPANRAKQLLSASSVVHTNSGPVVVSEIELTKIPLKMRARNVVIGADQAALHYGEKSFYAVRRNDSTRILLLRVVNPRVLREWLLALHHVVTRAVVRHEVRVWMDMRLKNFLKVFALHVGNVVRAHFPATLDKRNDLVHLGVSAATPRPFATLAANLAGLGAKVCLVGLYDLAATTKRTTVNLGHRLAQTMLHEPGGLVSYAQRAVQLVGAHALFAGGHQVSRQNPLVQGKFGVLKDGPDGHRKGLVAVLALVEAGARRFALQFVVIGANAPAMWADGAIWPTD